MAFASRFVPEPGRVWGPCDRPWIIDRRRGNAPRRRTRHGCRCGSRRGSRGGTRRRRTATGRSSSGSCCPGPWAARSWRPRRSRSPSTYSVIVLAWLSIATATWCQPTVRRPGLFTICSFTVADADPEPHVAAGTLAGAQEHVARGARAEVEDPLPGAAAAAEVDVRGDGRVGQRGHQRADGQVHVGVAPVQDQGLAGVTGAHSWSCR